MRSEKTTTAGLPEWIFVFAALFAIVWAIVRACVQSITVDEADTYFWFVARPGYLLYPFSNNHILNTLLMWATTHAFGLSSLTVRMPALLGGVLYISVCYFLCRTIMDQASLRLAVFICLVYNPFILDFMVAARGYSLANAFLLAAIAVPVWYQLKGGPLGSFCIFASLALGLSFAANFSFAFADLAAFLAIVLWALGRRRGESIIHILGCCVAPGLLVALLLCGYPLTHWPKGAFWQSANSLREMTQSMIEASLYRLNPRFIEIELYDTMDFLKPMLLPLLGILCVGQLIVTRLDARARWIGRFAAGLAGIMTFCVLLHWLAFRFGKLPLPIGRTGLFLLPLCTLLAGVIGAAPPRSMVGQWLRRGITVVFGCLACYFLLCLRLTYFKEYEFDADVKDVYAVLARLNHTYGVTDVASDGMYVNSLNFYRVVSKKETFPEFPYLESRQLPTGKSVYVLNEPWEKSFIDQQHLAIIYRGNSTEVIVAVRPGGPIPAVGLSP